MADPNLTITIQVVHGMAKAAFRDFAESAKRATKEMTDEQLKGQKTVENEARRYFERMRQIDREQHAMLQRSHLERIRTEGEERTAVQNTTLLTRNETAKRKEFLADLKRAIIERYSEENRLDRESEQSYVKAQRAKANAIRALEREQARQAREAARLAKEQEQGIMNIARAYTTLRIVSTISEGIKFAWMAVAESIKEARDYIQQGMDKMFEFRKQSIELMMLLGKPQTARAMAEFAGEAAVTGVRPAAAKTVYEEAFREMGGAIPEAGQPMLPGHRMTREAAQQFIRAVTPASLYAKGVTETEAGRLMGTMIQMAPKGATVEQTENLYAQILHGAVRARGRTSEMVDILTRVLPEVAPKGQPEMMIRNTAFASMLAERNLHDVPTYMRALTRAMTRMEIEAPQEEAKGEVSRMTQLGITPAMLRDPEAFFRQISARATAAERRGISENVFFAGAFPAEMREMIAMRTAAREAGEGTLERIQKEMAQQTGAGLTEAGRTAMQRGTTGGSIALEARKEAADLQRSAQDAALKDYELRAADMTAQELRRPEGMWEAILTQTGRLWQQGDRAAQAQRRNLASLIQQDDQQAGAAGLSAATRLARARLAGEIAESKPWWEKLAFFAQHPFSDQGPLQERITTTTPEHLVSRAAALSQEALSEAAAKLSQAADKLDAALNQNGGGPAPVGPANAIPMQVGGPGNGRP